MRILFDQGTPVPLRRAFDGHSVETAFEHGWSQIENGALIQSAESLGFDVYVTTDKNLRYQKTMAGRRLAILVLWTTSWPEIRPHADGVAVVALAQRQGEFRELDRPS